jgi:hypothetical protein
MSDDTPTRVGFWSYATGVGRKVAEFTRQPDGSVRFRELDRDWAAPARDYFDNGVPLLAGGQASDPPLTGVSDPDAVRLRPTGPARGLSVEDAYRVLSGLPPGPVEVPPLPDEPERRDRP